MLTFDLKIRHTGVTLIELMIGVAVVGILAAIAAPNFTAWLRNTEIRNAAESIANGIQRARAEAVKLNTDVEFVLGVDSSWTVNQVLPPSQIDSRASNEGSKHVTITTLPPATKITFNNLGAVVANGDGSVSLGQLDFTTVGGTRDLRVTIGLGGNARMCDPNLATGISACY